MASSNRFTKEKEQELIDLLSSKPYVYYADYRDTIEKGFLKELLQDIEKHPDIAPLSLFTDKIDECYEGGEFPPPELFAPDIGLAYGLLSEEDRERFDEVFMEHIQCEPDYDHFLDQEICVDIIIDSGDFNYDLGCNQVYPHYDGDYDDLNRHGVPEKSCIWWLAKKQGYTKRQTKAALLNKEYGGSKFLESLREELLNCTSHMNCLVFMKKTTIRQWLEMLDAKSVTIPRQTGCGLVDYWCGAGSLLDIRLEKDIKATKKNISEIIPDECKSYSIHNIYGCADDLWN